MTLGELSPAIAGAFASMAEHIPGATVMADPQWGLQVQSSLRHPIGNFAWVDSIELWQERDLPILNGTSFNVYLPFEGIEAPYISGFRHALTQHTMMAEARRRPYEAKFRVDESKTPLERRKTADFMVSLFYQSSSRETKGIMTRSIESASSLRLFSISDGKGGISAACALFVGHDVWGLYNVIVAEDLRGAGRGQALIAEMLALGNQAGRLIQLQCNSNLVDWYGYLGFKPHSYLHIYCV